MATTRRLAAILAADVASYSRLMSADEEGTHERLMAHLQELVNPKIKEHHGRTVKNTGDGFLAEFASVLDAVRCAAEIQRGMVDREAGISDERSIRFRVSVNLGDVIVEEHDIFGTGVNVAARLEALAEPGGICITQIVREEIQDKLGYFFEDKGEQYVKNITRPVRVHEMRPEAVASLPLSGSQLAMPTTRPTSAPRMSIVVLPFVNLSNDPEQEYFADGITDDITTDLSRIDGSFVIACSTASTYKGKSVDVRQIGHELGVRYVLEGTVRRSRNQIRLNAQLIDAERDAHLWAERFTGDASDLLALQDEITSRIAVALDLELVDAEAARPNENPDILDYILRGRAEKLKPPSRETRARAVSFFEQALALDKNSVAAQSWLAIELAARALDFMTDSSAADIKRAEELAKQAFATAPRRSLVHFAKGQVLRAQHRYDEAIPEYEAVIALSRNWAYAYSHVGWCKFMSGAIEELIPTQERAIRLSPRDPQIGLFYSRVGRAHLLLSRVDEAIIWCEKARNATPAAAIFRSFLASAYALKGEIGRAAAEMAEARRLVRDDRYSSIARLRALEPWGVPKVHDLLETTYFAGLRKAGMREE